MQLGSIWLRSSEFIPNTPQNSRCTLAIVGAYHWYTLKTCLFQTLSPTIPPSVLGVGPSWFSREDSVMKKVSEKVGVFQNTFVWKLWEDGILMDFVYVMIVEKWELLRLWEVKWFPLKAIEVSGQMQQTMSCLSCWLSYETGWIDSGSWIVLPKYRITNYSPQN